MVLAYADVIRFGNWPPARGISATILIFLMTVAGLASPNDTRVRLYDDSLSAYAKDSSLPYTDVASSKAARSRL